MPLFGSYCDINCLREFLNELNPCGGVTVHIFDAREEIAFNTKVVEFVDEGVSTNGIECLSIVNKASKYIFLLLLGVLFNDGAQSEDMITALGSTPEP